MPSEILREESTKDRTQCLAELPHYIDVRL